MEFPQRNATGTSRFAGLDKSVSNATTFGLILWIASSYWFKKQYFIKDKNLFNLVMFSSASSSPQWQSLALSWSHPMQLPHAETTLTSTDISISLDTFEEGAAGYTCDYNSPFI